MRTLIALCLVLALSGFTSCQKRPDPPQVPEIIKVPVRTTVPVPAELTTPCPIARAESRTVEAVVSAYNANIETLESCANRKLQEIRALPTSEATP